MFKVLLVVPRFLILQFEFFLHNRVCQHLLKSVGRSAQLSRFFFYKSMMKTEFDNPWSARLQPGPVRAHLCGLTFRAVLTTQ